ncbi:hypothetical protein [Streptomyces anulatus]|uniref:hypothetical protein n=1 Tax=Streptomyces anulatus TaxID=1892 RepID=UPI0034447893
MDQTKPPAFLAGRAHGARVEAVRIDLAEPGGGRAMFTRKPLGDSGGAPIHAEGAIEMSNPQQPEQRRSDKGGATPQDSAERKAREPGAPRDGGAHAHGTDKGGKGGGPGGGVPPEERPEHP